MTEDQKRIAAEAIAEIVKNAIDVRESPPSAEALIALAENAARAISAGCTLLNGAT